MSHNTQVNALTAPSGFQPVPNADHIGEALEALDELRDAGRELKAALIRGGEGVTAAEQRFSQALATMNILSQEAKEHEAVAA